MKAVSTNSSDNKNEDSAFATNVCKVKIVGVNFFYFLISPILYNTLSKVAQMINKYNKNGNNLKKNV